MAGLTRGGMTRGGLVRSLNELFRVMGEQMQLCCGRTLGNLPTLPGKGCDGARLR